MTEETDLVHLRRCVELARAALEGGDEPFGSVLVSANASADVRALDLDAAEQHFRAALTEQQWTDGFEFTTIYNSGNTFRQSTLQGIADNLAAVNPAFVMNVDELPFSEFLNQTYSGQMPIALTGWAADYGDASNFVNSFYDASGNFSAATSIDVPAIQLVVDDAKAEFDAAARAAIYEQLGDLHYEHAPMIVLPSLAPVLVVREGATGIYYNSVLSGNFLLKDISKD